MERQKLFLSWMIAEKCLDPINTQLFSDTYNSIGKTNLIVIMVFCVGYIVIEPNFYYFWIFKCQSPVQYLSETRSLNNFGNPTESDDIPAIELRIKEPVSGGGGLSSPPNLNIQQFFSTDVASNQHLNLKTSNKYDNTSKFLLSSNDQDGTSRNLNI